MLVMGLETFDWDDEDADEKFETSYALEKVTIECTAWEIENLIRFLEKAKKDYVGIDGYGHEHLQDWDKEWTETESDVVIEFNLNSL